MNSLYTKLSANSFDMEYTQLTADGLITTEYMPLTEKCYS